MKIYRLSRKEMQDEILIRLRNQKESMELGLRRQLEKQRTMSEVERLREEIRRMGGTPCA